MSAREQALAGSIGHMRCRYSLFGEQAAAQVLGQRFERTDPAAVARGLEGVLAGALSGDATVYILRRVEASLAVRMEGSADEGVVARGIGDRLGGLVLRSLALDPGDGANLVRFDDQAAFVARFATDLVEDRAWGRWYFGAFRRFQGAPTRSALLAVLIENRAHLPRILAALQRAGALGAVLRALGLEGSRALWNEDDTASGALSLENGRPLLAAALRVLNDLRLRTRTPAGPELLEAYLASHPLPVGWGDPRELAAAVLDVIRVLVEEGYVARIEPHASIEFESRLDVALSALEWLDRAWLREALRSLFVPMESLRPTARVLAARPTPHHLEQLNALLEVLRSGRLALDYDEPASPQNALRLYAGLVERSSGWADDPTLPELIRWVLSLWASRASARSPRSRRAARQRSSLEGDAATSPLRMAQQDQVAAVGAERGHTRRATEEGDADRMHGGLGERAAGLQGADGRFEAHDGGLGELGIEVVDALLDLADESISRPVGVHTDCAGLFLLLRAIQDSRVTSMVEPLGLVGSPGPAPLAFFVTSLFLAWGGEAAVQRGRTDSAVARLAGWEEPPTLGDLARAWSPAMAPRLSQLQRSVARVLAANGLLQGRIPRLDLVQHQGASAVILSAVPVDGVERRPEVWPFGDVLSVKERLASQVLAWMDVWQSTTGVRPPAVECDPRLLRLVAVPLGSAGFDTRPASRLGEGVRHALASLGSPGTGKRDADLTVSLVATSLLRIWARWLRGFGESSVSYLLQSLVRRSGVLFRDGEGLRVVMEPRPLDVVLDMAGYLDDLAVPEIGIQRIRFIVEPS